MPYKDPVIERQYQKNYRANNKDKRAKINVQTNTDSKQYASDCIASGEIIDQRKWDKWCNKIKRSAENNKRPYPIGFTNYVMFEMMLKGCFYCGDVATTIDRIDSTLYHTLDNCVGCCEGCNYSKGASDPSTFVKKAYYRARGEYVDTDTDIWTINETKPRITGYKKSAEKKEVPFELSKNDFEDLIVSICEYCHRKPEKWFGIDRIIPSKGYVIGNVVSCCFDCNVDKFKSDVDATSIRNERIANRIDIGEFIIEDYTKVILHKGTNKTSKKVCAFGNMYVSRREASRTLGKGGNYVCECINKRIHPDDIFDISEEFYDEYKDVDMYITKTMYIGFEHFYVSDD